MSCAGAAVRVPRLAGARSCCPSRADSVLHGQEEAAASCTLLSGSPYAPWSLGNSACFSLHRQWFPGRVPGCVAWATPQPQPPPCAVGRRWNGNTDKSICPRTAGEAALFTSGGWTSTLPHLRLRQQCHPAAPLQGRFQGEGAGICKTPVMIVYSCHF